MVERLARSTGGPGSPAPTVLLLGETGSGKGHVARAVHAASGRRDGPFIEVNCTALPEALVEAELFGYEKGRVHRPGGARRPLRDRRGRALPRRDRPHLPALQGKFLKAIEEKTVRRIGASAMRKVDVRFVAATNRDLEAAVRLGEFREDLYQRLTGAVIRIPPLREREGDAVRLAHTFLAEGFRRYAVAPRQLSAEAESAIGRYAWPGNVRELANLLERAVALSDHDTLLPEDLDFPTNALDRLLQWGSYVVPNWYLAADRVAYWDRFSRPALAPKVGYDPSTWWVDAKKDEALRAKRGR